MVSSVVVNKPGNSTSSSPAVTPSPPTSVLSTGTATAGLIDPDLARRDILAAHTYGGTTLEKALALHECTPGKDDQRAKDIINGLTAEEKKTFVAAMQYVLNTRESTRMTANIFLTPWLDTSEQPVKSPTPEKFDAMETAKKLAGIAEDHYFRGNNGRPEKIVSEIQNASPEQREQIAKAWRELISSQLKELKIGDNKATGDFLRDISPVLNPEQQLRVGQLLQGFNSDAFAKYCKDYAAFPAKLLSALKGLNPEQIRAIDESLKKNFPKDLPLGLLQLVSNAPSTGASGKTELLTLVISALNSKDTPPVKTNPTNPEPNTGTGSGPSQTAPQSKDKQTTTRVHSGQIHRTTVDAHLGFVQEKLLAFDKNLVMQAIHEVYPGKSDEQCQRIATDGKRGPATDLAISRIREKLGLSKDGEPDREFMIKLSEAISAKGPGSAPTGEVVEVPIPSAPSAAHTLPEATASERAEIVDQVRLLIDKHRSPKLVLQQVAATYSESTIAQLDKDLTDKHGRSIIQQMTNEKHDILPESIAAVAEILHPGKYDSEAVLNAVKLARALKDDKKDEIRKIINGLSSRDEVKNLADAFEGLLATDDSRAKFRKHMEKEDSKMPIDDKDKVRFLRYVVQEKGVFNKSVQTTTLVDDGPSIA